MANPNVYAGQLRAQINQLVTTLQNLDTLQDMLAQDSTLAASAAVALSTQGQPPLTAADVNAAAASVNQIIFTFNSGSPPQKAALYKLQ